MNEERKKELQKLFIDAAREINAEELPGLYAAMIVSETDYLGPFRKITVHLINNTETNYASVKVLTGALASIDSDLMETGKGITGPFEMPAYSARKIGASDTGELDFIVWFDLDMTDGEGFMEQYRFSLPKPYLWKDYKLELVPFIDLQGMLLSLSAREGGSIDDYVRENGLKPRYFEERGGEMVQTE